VTGVGKSAIAARAIAATFSTMGIPALFYDAVGLYHGELGALRPGDLVILISHSGKTEELVRLLPHLQERGCIMASIVGDAQSCIGQLRLTVTTQDTQDYQNVPTASFAATCALGHALAVAAATIRGEGFAQHHPGGTIGKALATT